MASKPCTTINLISSQTKEGVCVQSKKLDKNKIGKALMIGVAAVATVAVLAVTVAVSVDIIITLLD